MIRIELAGVASQDIDLTFQESVLTISGERKRDLDDEVSFFVHERFYGVFRRNITLRAGISEDDISADFDNGLVEITVRDGAVGAEPRRIEIRNRTT
jgi:HSP20 family protein